MPVGWRAPGLGWLMVGATLAGLSAPAAAQTGSAAASRTESETPAEDDDTSVSMEFLEFLGEWESGNGEWVDPAEVQSEDWPVLSSDSTDTGESGNEN